MADLKVACLKNSQYDNTKKIKVFFKSSSGDDVQIELHGGEIVYAENNSFSNSLRIYSKKGIISITEENKPLFLDYYSAYSGNDVDVKKLQHTLENSIEIPFGKQKGAEHINEEKTQNPPVQKEKTVVDKAIENAENYSIPKKSHKKKTGPGRPKKRGPKKGSKRVKKEE